MFRFFVAISIWLSLLSFSTSVAQTYLWPTNSGNYLSGTFGETRSAHFHAGLDIKTWGREGYPVYATRDGVLERLLVTERGYGNAIYLRHNDSTYSIYAHLQRFSDPFKKLADSIRLKDYSFEMHALLDTLELQVQKGDLIGYSGSTGIGPPHLHFELRDSLNQPFNALTTNLKINDDLPPVFSSLIIEPLDINSRIDGKPVSVRKRTSINDNGVYNFGEIAVNGTAGLAVNVFDQANDVHNAYAVYTLSLMHEGDTLFHEKLDRFSYDISGEMFLDRIAPFGSDRRGHQRLYAKDGHNNPFYLTTKPEAKIKAENEPKTYQIVATDYFGNTASAKITIIPVTDTPDTSSSDISSPAKDWYWSENWASTDLQSTLDLTRDDLGFPWTDNQQMLQTPFSEMLMLARVYPEKSSTIITPDHRMKFWFGDHTFFDTLTVVTSYQIIGENIHISVQPQMLASKTPFKLEFYLDDMFQPGNGYRLFSKDEKDGSLDYVPSTLIGRTVHAVPKVLGEFTIAADNNPPEITDFRIYQTDYGMWQASVHVKDELTGINSSSAWFSVNGTRGIAEYDYEEELLIYYLPGFTPQEENSAQIRLSDNAGNEQSVGMEYRLARN